MCGAKFNWTWFRGIYFCSGSMKTIHHLPFTNKQLKMIKPSKLPEEVRYVANISIASNHVEYRDNDDIHPATPVITLKKVSGSPEKKKGDHFITAKSRASAMRQAKRIARRNATYNMGVHRNHAIPIIIKSLYYESK